MTEAAVHPIHSPMNTRRMMVEFFGTYKFVLAMLGGMMLSTPIWQDVPTVMGWIGVGVALVGMVAQVVKILYDLGENKRKAAAERRVQEEHEAKMALYRAHVEAGELKEAGEVLG